MNTMDNAKAIEAMEKMTIQKYLQNLVDTRMHKVTLFPVFSHTAAPNLSDPRYYVMVEDLTKLVELNSGAFNN